MGWIHKSSRSWLAIIYLDSKLWADSFDFVLSCYVDNFKKTDSGLKRVFPSTLDII